jgi:hypothetical protein
MNKITADYYDSLTWEDVKGLKNFELYDVDGVIKPTWDSKMEATSGSAVVRRMLQVANRGTEVVGAVSLGINDCIKKDLGGGVANFETHVMFNKPKTFQFGCDFTKEEMEGCISFDAEYCDATTLPPLTKPDVPISTGLEALEEVESGMANGLLGSAIRSLSILVGLSKKAGSNPDNLYQYFSDAWGLDKKDVELMARPLATVVSAGRMSALVGKATTQILGKENMGGTVKLIPTGLTTAAWDDVKQEDELVTVDWGRFETFIKSISYAVHDLHEETSKKLSKMKKAIIVNWKLNPSAAIIYKKSDFTPPILPKIDTSHNIDWKVPLRAVAEYLKSPDRVAEALNAYGLAIAKMVSNDRESQDYSISDLKHARGVIRKALTESKTDYKSIRENILDIKEDLDFRPKSWSVFSEEKTRLSKTGIWTSCSYFLMPLDRIKTVALASAAFSAITNYLPLKMNYSKWVPSQEQSTFLIPKICITASLDFKKQWFDVINMGRGTTAHEVVGLVEQHADTEWPNFLSKAASALLNLNPNAFLSRMHQVSKKIKDRIDSAVIEDIPMGNSGLIAGLKEKIKFLVARAEGIIYALKELKDEASAGRVVYHQLLSKVLTSGYISESKGEVNFVKGDMKLLVKEWIKNYSRRKDQYEPDSNYSIIELLDDADNRLRPKFSFRETFQKMETTIDYINSDYKSENMKTTDVRIDDKLTPRHDGWYTLAPSTISFSEEDIDLTNFDLSSFVFEDDKESDESRLQAQIVGSGVDITEVTAFLKEASMGAWLTLSDAIHSGYDSKQVKTMFTDTRLWGTVDSVVMLRDHIRGFLHISTKRFEDGDGEEESGDIS